jgi:hypothetical protein
MLVKANQELLHPHHRSRHHKSVYKSQSMPERHRRDVSVLAQNAPGNDGAGKPLFS